MNAPLTLFPFVQSRINAMLEDADEERAAGDHRWADHLVEKARREAQALAERMGLVAA